jgi:hypothetical protein
MAFRIELGLVRRQPISSCFFWQLIILVCGSGYSARMAFMNGGQLGSKTSRGLSVEYKFSTILLRSNVLEGSKH